jgi:hypothetical protein
MHFGAAQTSLPHPPEPHLTVYFHEHPSLIADREQYQVQEELLHPAVNRALCGFRPRLFNPISPLLLPFFLPTYPVEHIGHRSRIVIDVR